jgi:fatty-acyl-CoA synthase
MAQGIVCHTLNPRLFDDQLVFIANEAADRWLLVDVDQVPLVERLMPRLKFVLGVIVLTDRAHMPSSSSFCLLCYEDLLAAETPPADLGAFEWSERDESAPAGLCFTSGTTGDPKGVVYTHRSQVLHSMAVCLPDVLGLSSTSVILLVVPAFHANGWGLMSASLLAGSRLVMPGPRLDGASLHALITSERATLAAAVPTVWMGLLSHLQSTPGASISSLKRVIIGGAAVPEAMLLAFERDYGVSVCHAYGLSECSPLLTLNTEKGGVPRTHEQKLKQGRAMYTAELRIVDDSGRELPRDGVATGSLQARGPGVVATYYKNAGGKALTADGWFDTGDVATIGPDAFITIVDRTKDIIKSGGEWISSVEVECVAMGFAPLASAACIGIPDEKWGERPILLAVLRPGAHATAEEVLEFLKPRIAKWWLPDRVVFVSALPQTATGKFDKKAMRAQFAAARARL